MIMNFKEYKRNLEENKDFAPGIDAINEALEVLYGEEECTSFNLIDVKNALAPCPKPSLLGFSAYPSSLEKPHYHITSFGFSELFANEHSFLREKSKLGYELTLRVNTIEENKISNLLNVINNIFKYNVQTSTKLEPYTVFDCKKALGESCKYAGFVILPDTSLKSLDTVHGEVHFLQACPIDCCTLASINNGTLKLQDIIEALKEKSPNCIYHLL